MRPQHLILASIFAASTSFAALAQPANPPAAPKEGEKAKAPEGQPAGRPNRPGAGGGQGRNALSPEKAKAAWEAQATGVAKRNSLSTDQTKTLVTAYTAARESQQVAAQKLRDDQAAKGGDRGPEAMTAREDMNKAEKAKFEKALTGFKAEEITKVSAGLSTFNRQWDGITNALIDMKLEEVKQQTAFNAVEDYIVTQSQFMARIGDPDIDQAAMRTAMQENRTKLTDAFAKVLTPEQAKTIEESIGRGGRGPGGRGGAGGPGGPGGDRPATRPDGDKKPESPK